MQTEAHWGWQILMKLSTDITINDLVMIAQDDVYRIMVAMDILHSNETKFYLKTDQFITCNKSIQSYKIKNNLYLLHKRHFYNQHIQHISNVLTISNFLYFLMTFNSIYPKGSHMPWVYLKCVIFVCYNRE